MSTYFRTGHSIPKVIKVNVPTSVINNSAQLSGWFESSGVSFVGVCLSESPNVTISDKKGDEQKTIHDGTNGNFIQAITRNFSITGLKSKTKYFYKMYAKNEKGIVFSEENSFTTL